MTEGDILSVIAQTLLLGGVVFAFVCLMTSLLRFQQLTRRSKSAVQLEDQSNAFQLYIARQLGTAHRQPAPFTAVLVSPENWDSLADQLGEAKADGLAKLVEVRLRSMVRRTDMVMNYRSGVTALILRAPRLASESIGRRILQDASREGFRLADGPMIQLRLKGGAAAYPEDGDRAAALRAKAEEALASAGASTPLALMWPPDTVAPSLPGKIAHAGAPDEDTKDQKSLLDELTGVLKENQLGPALQKYVAQCRRDERPVSVLCLDVDYLRRYNDQYGRRTGDQLLRHVADYLKHATREEDLIARHAGDQFVIALPTLPQHALAVGQRIWSGLRKTAFEGSGPGLRLTVTVGVASFPDHGLIGRELFESAELALLVGKKKGRNQCLMFQEPMRKMIGVVELGDSF